MIKSLTILAYENVVKSYFCDSAFFRFYFVLFLAKSFTEI